MKQSAKVNHKEWRNAMRTWRRAKRDPAEADVINHFATDTLWNAIPITPSMDLSKKYVKRTHRPDQRFARAGKGKSRWTYTRKLWFAKAVAGGARRGNIRKEATRLYRRARSAKGANQAGFFKPLKDMGEPVTQRLFAGGSAAAGYGILATSKKLWAEALNGVDGSGTVSEPAVIKAMNITARQETVWALERLAKAKRGFSD